MTGAMIGILGGLGPAAGLLLHQAILQHTRSGGVDQGHLRVCHLSCSGDVPSRVAFLAREAHAENPALGMARTFELLRAMAHNTADPLEVIVGVPCITFHAPPIWDEFRTRIATQQIGEQSSLSRRPIRVLHLLDETARFLRELVPACGRVGVMSTTSTRELGLYRDLLEPLGIVVVEVPDKMQEELHETIMNPEWGIKSNAPNVGKLCIDNFHRFSRHLIAEGAEAIILGCTEIPFVFGESTRFEGATLINPLVALARALVREVDSTKLATLVPS